MTCGPAGFGGHSSIVQSQLQDVQQVQVASAGAGAFAAIFGDESVVTWGNASLGDDSTSVQGQLTNEQQVQASAQTFAALLGNACLAMGRLRHGAMLTLVATAVLFKPAVECKVHGFYGAFAAILGDGSVVTWGHADYGGDSSAVQGQLTNVQQVQASLDACAAVLGDGSIGTCGSAGFGGDSSAVQGQLQNV